MTEQPTDEPMIPAELEPVADKPRQAAQALQALGFRVLRVDDLISVNGPKSLWESVFGVTFEPGSKPAFPGAGEAQTEFYVPTEETVTVPDELAELIKRVIFPRPPEFFG